MFSFIKDIYLSFWRVLSDVTLAIGVLEQGMVRATLAIISDPHMAVPELPVSNAWMIIAEKELCLCI